MFRDKKPTGFGSYKRYIINTLKFYEMKNESITQLIFIIILFAGFSAVMFFSRMDNSPYLFMFFGVLCFVIIYFASTIYLEAYLCELRGKDYSFKSCFSSVISKFHKLVLSFISFSAILSIGTFLLIIPAFIFYFMFLFNTCYILEKNTGVMEAFNASRHLTTGRKMVIFSLFVVIDLILYFPMNIVPIITAILGNYLISIFVSIFGLSIVTIMQQRLIAMLYVDLEYNTSDIKNNGDENEFF